MSFEAEDNISEKVSPGSVGYYSWNVPENRVYGDDVIGHVFGLSARELAEGVPIERTVGQTDDGDRQRLAKVIHEAILSGLPSRCEFSVTHADGTRLTVLASGRCLRDAQGVPSIYSGVVTILPSLSGHAAHDGERDQLESHCRAALGLANGRRNMLAARYISSALNVLHARRGC